VKADELHKLSSRELETALDAAKEELFNLRFQLATNQLDNTSRLGHVKREIARIGTVIRQKEIAAWERLQEAE
jgi:large subunit ribosomal protein L29